jgi:hypothetical protein
VGAIRQAGSAASTVNRFLPAFQREIADNVGPLMHNDTGGAQSPGVRSPILTGSPPMFHGAADNSAGELTIRTLHTEWNGCATKDGEI